MGSTSGSSTIRVAVTQHEPEWLDLKGSVAKTCAIMKEAAQAGAKLVVFPEVWIPGYPCWIWTKPVDFELGVKYVQNSLKVDSPEMNEIKACAAEHGINVALGFSERDGDSVYIAQALIDETGTLQMTRRKFRPTHMERTIFGDASGDCLAKVTNLPKVGRVGMLSCWEHMQPLVKFYTFSQGQDLHVAAWPPMDGFVQGSPGFYSMSAEGCLNLSQAYAMESQSYVLHCTSVLTEKGIDLFKTNNSPIMGTPISGSSHVIGTDGRLMTPEETANEQLILADLDLDQVIRAKTFADASGHYSRPDMLWLGADDRKKTLVRNALG